MGALLRLGKQEPQGAVPPAEASQKESGPLDPQIAPSMVTLRWALVSADLTLAALALCLVWTSTALNKFEVFLICGAVGIGAWLACLAILQGRR